MEKEAAVAGCGPGAGEAVGVGCWLPRSPSEVWGLWSVGRVGEVAQGAGRAVGGLRGGVTVTWDCVGAGRGRDEARRKEGRGGLGDGGAELGWGERRVLSKPCSRRRGREAVGGEKNDVEFSALEGRPEADDGRIIRRRPGWSLRRSFAGGLYFASLFMVVWASAPYPRPAADWECDVLARCSGCCWYQPHALRSLVRRRCSVLLCAQPYHKYSQVTNPASRCPVDAEDEEGATGPSNGYSVRVRIAYYCKKVLHNTPRLGAQGIQVPVCYGSSRDDTATNAIPSKSLPFNHFFIHREARGPGHLESAH